MALKNLLDINTLSKSQLIAILDRATDMKKSLLSRSEVDHLKGKNVVTLFYENSTRTKSSFEFAAKKLKANLSSLAVATSSVKKGESLVDTGKTLDALQTDIIIIRHQQSGAPLFLQKNVKARVVNAGDGMHAHPTQALLDFMTMREKYGDFKGLSVAILGDVKHSRVARSNLAGLLKLGAEVRYCCPPTLMPFGFEDMGAKIYANADDCVRGADVVMGLRIQLERQQQGLFPSVSEYNSLYGLTSERIALASPNAIVMHPGPINRGVEIDSDVADCDCSKINEQVTNGVAVRMSVLSLIGEDL